jgi:hypothetical protein
MAEPETFQDDAGNPVGPRTQAYLSALHSQLGTIRQLLDLRWQLTVLAGPSRELAKDPAAETTALVDQLQKVAARVADGVREVSQALEAAADAWTSGAETEPIRERARLTAEIDQLAAAAHRP